MAFNKIPPSVALSKTITRPISLLLQPVASNEQIVMAWKNYQALKKELLSNDDYQLIQGKKCIKKSGWRKIQTAFGISDELIKEERKDFGKYFTYEITVKVSAQNGRFAYGVGSCASNERNFAHLEHDVRSTAHTRAKNRAISDLVGGGEVSAEEMEAEVIIRDEATEVKENNEWLDDIFANQEPEQKNEARQPEKITPKQRTLLISLIAQRIADPEEKRERMEILGNLTKREAHQAISELL